MAVPSIKSNSLGEAFLEARDNENYIPLTWFFWTTNGHRLTAFNLDASMSISKYIWLDGSIDWVLRYHGEWGHDDAPVACVIPSWVVKDIIELQMARFTSLAARVD